jgi:hypothetical protein
MRANGHVLKPADISIQSLFDHIAALIGKVFSKGMIANTAMVAATVVIFGLILFAFNHALHNYTVLGPYMGAQTGTFNGIAGTLGGGTLL